MKRVQFKIGDLVGFKGRGLGFGRISSITPQRGSKDSYIYHVILLKGDMLVGTSGEHIEKIEGEEGEMINALGSIGNL